MQVSDEIQALIAEHGGVLERQHKHNVYKFPDGKTFITAKSPSDRRTDWNNLSQLRRLLGIKRESNKNPDRREKVGVAKPVFQPSPPASTVVDFRSQLRAAIEKAEREQLNLPPAAVNVEAVQQAPVPFGPALLTICPHRTQPGLSAPTYWCRECKKSFCNSCFHSHNDDFHPGFVYYGGKG